MAHGHGHGHEVVEDPLYGLTAEFSDPESVLAAANAAREAGYKKMDAFVPFPIHGLSEAIGQGDYWLPKIVFCGGLAGAAGGWGLQYYTAVYDYAMNVGGKPLLSWPQMIPIAYECTILLAALSAVFGMLALNGLPRPYHSIFNAKNFERASQDKFFLCIEASDKLFDREATAEFLRRTGADVVAEVEK